MDLSVNNRLSGRQIFRKIVVVLIGPSVLVVPYVVSGFSGETGAGTGDLISGLLSFIVASVLSFLYILFVRKAAGSKGFSLLKVKVAINFFGEAVLMAEIVKKVLGSGLWHLPLIILSVSGILAFITWGYEAAGRTCEVLFHWIIIPLIIILVMALPGVDGENLRNAFTLQVHINNKWPKILWDIISNGILMWFFLGPAELLAFEGQWDCKREVKGKSGKTEYVEKSAMPYIYGAAAFVFTINVVVIIILTAIYGSGAMGKFETFPFLYLMQIGGVPGNFVGRLDGIMSLLLILSIFPGLAVMAQSLFKKDRRCSRLFNCIFISLFFASAIAADRYFFSPEYNNDRNKPVYAQIEDRAFVMSVIVDEWQKQVVFEIGDNREEKWKETSIYRTVENCTIIERAREIYEKQYGDILDFGQMKMVFLPEKTINSEINLSYLHRNTQFPQNLTVCPVKGSISFEDGKSLAVPVENLINKKNIHKELMLYRYFSKNQN